MVRRTCNIKIGRDTKIPQSGGPLVKVGDEAVHKELGNIMEMDSTTDSSLEAEQNSDTILGDMDAQTRFETTSKWSNDPPLSRGYTLRSGKDIAFLEKPVESNGFAEIINFLKASYVHYALTINPIIYTSCIQQFWATANVKMVNGVRQLQALIDKKKISRSQALEVIFTWKMQKVLDLEKAKSDQAIEIASLKKRVDKLEKRRKFKTTRLKRLKKVGAARRIESSNDSTDISKITRKQSKTGKHGHENQKGTKRSQRIKAKARKVKPAVKSSQHGQPKSTH
ncbi:hypothetical protein Tco_1258404 [Tanacetum coccineum]